MQSWRSRLSDKEWSKDSPAHLSLKLSNVFDVICQFSLPCNNANFKQGFPTDTLATSQTQGDPHTPVAAVQTLRTSETVATSQTQGDAHTLATSKTQGDPHTLATSQTQGDPHTLVAAVPTLHTSHTLWLPLPLRLRVILTLW